MIRQWLRQIRADWRAWHARRRFRRHLADYHAAKVHQWERDYQAAQERTASRMPPHERARHEADNT